MSQVRKTSSEKKIDRYELTIGRTIKTDSSLGIVDLVNKIGQEEKVVVVVVFFFGGAVYSPVIHWC